MAKSMYDIIKKQNGEGFARVLRDKGLLDIPNIAHIVKYAGHDTTSAEKIFPYLWSLKEFKEEPATTNADPFQLLDMAGYHAFEVHNLQEQNSIRRFFRTSEELCTFSDDERYQDNYMIHAIKHEVWRDPYAIKPSKNPERQDEYGTSVISIQIRKDGGFISIKNRYNHSVDNPDQTFHSNPDEIIAGLSGALKAYFDVDWKSTNHLPSGFILMNNQVLQISHERNNNYVGDGFYTQDGQVIDVDKNSQIQMDYFIWDNNRREMLNPLLHDDGFQQAFLDQVQGKKVTISGKYPNQTIMADGVKVIELKNCKITTLNFPDVTQIDDCFLMFNKSLKSISLPHVTEIGGSFLYQNRILDEISIPSVTKIDSSFLHSAIRLKSLSAPKLKSVGPAFLLQCQNLTEINVPELETVDIYFLHNNKKLNKLSLPKVTTIGSYFLEKNKLLSEIYLPLVKIIGGDFLTNNNNMRQISLPSVIRIGDHFMDSNAVLHSISLPNVREIGRFFLKENTAMTNISLPSIKKIDSYFMQENKSITRPILPQSQKHTQDRIIPVIDNIPAPRQPVYHMDNTPAPATPSPQQNTSVVQNQNRGTLAKRFKHAIQKFYDYIRMTYRANSDYEI